jgi:hypothetical protein
MRVGLEHFGQSVLLLVSIAFLRSPVLAIFAILLTSPVTDLWILARGIGGAWHTMSGAGTEASTASRGMNRESKEKSASRILSQFTRFDAAGATDDSSPDAAPPMFR